MIRFICLQVCSSEVRILSTEDVGAWVTSQIKGFLDSSENNLGEGWPERAWGEPLVGFSCGADPLYDFYKRDIGDFYLLPIEFFSQTFPGVKAEPTDLAIVSWVLPQTEATKSDHRKESTWPAERWARSRIFGEEVNNRLRSYLVQRLAGEGIQAVAPMLSPLWSSQRSEKYSFASAWSERHAAYAAGLGTFGLSDGLITPAGKAHRCGSVIAKVRIAPTPRTYTDHHAYCLFYAKGTCGVCVSRCPVGAITEKGHDKERCRAHLESSRTVVERTYGFKGYGCGLCQTNVPCESRIPEGI